MPANKWIAPDKDELNRIREDAMRLAGIGVYRYDFGGSILYMDKITLKILEVDDIYSDPCELKGLKLSQIIDHIEPEETVRNLIREKKYVRDLEYSFCTKKGTRKWVLYNSHILHDDNIGDYIHTHIQDITSRKSIEETLIQGQQQLRQIIDHVPHMIFAKDKTGMFLLANKAIAESYGTTSDNIVGKKEQIFSKYPKELKYYQQADNEVINSGKRKYIPSERYHDSDGNLHFLETTKIPFKFTGHTEKAVLGVSIDITDRVNALNALKSSEARYRSLYATMSEGMALHKMIYDKTTSTAKDYRIIDVNPAYEKIIGIPRKKAIGKPASKLYGTENPPFMEIYEKVVRTKKPVSFETYFQPLDKHLQISVFSPAKGEFATVFTDITERKRIEIEQEKLIKKLEDKNAELERFAYSVSHDLKSPLITIKGFLEILEHNAIKGNILGMRTAMDRIYIAADKMHKLLEELLELARIGYLVKPVDGISSDEAVNEAIQLVHGRLFNNKVKVSIMPGMPAIKADPKRMVEVFQNLIENAVKFMGNQENPQIDIGFQMNNESNPVFFVRDNGIGIETQFQHKIFGLFEKLDSKIDGTGIGLALTKRIIETHGGKIWVESEGSGKGATFYFTMMPHNS